MKKILLTLFVFLSIPSFAQYVESVAEFDFTKPGELVSDPPITFLQGTLDYLLDDKTIYANDGDVIMSFTDAGNGVVYNYVQEESDTIYFMQIRTWGEMKIRLGKNGYELQKIEFTGFTGELGNVNTVDKTWYGNGKHVSDVTFTNGTTLTVIYKVRVTYLKKAEPLKLLNHDNYSSFSGTSFKTIPLYFNQKVNVEYPDSARLYHLNSDKERDAEGVPMRMTVDKTNGNRVILSVVNPVKNGTYEISIPKDVIKTSQGAGNDAITLYYTYDGKLEPPVISPVPEDTTYFQLPQEVLLTFDQDVVVDHDYKYVSEGIVDPNHEYYVYNISQDGLEPNQVKLTIDFGDNFSSESLMEQGEWTYIVPEGAIRAMSSEELPNSTINIYYTVDNTSALLEEIKVLDIKSRNGNSAAVGYPNLESPGRVALNSILDGKVHSYAEIKDSLYSFSQEKDVMLPEDGKWYQIVGVVGNDRLYLRSHNGELSLQQDIKNASAFKIVTLDGKFNILTKEGLYLNIVEKAGNTGVNIETSKESQNIALEKYFVENDTIIGLLTLSASDILFAETKMGDSLSRGFMLIESNEQANLIKPEIKLSSSLIDKAGDYLLLTVYNVDKVYLMDNYAPYYKKNGVMLDLYNPVLVKGESDCEFLVKTEELTAAGEYELVIPAGIFKYVKEGYDASEIEVTDLSIKFTIGKGSSNVDDPTLPKFNFDYSKYNLLQYNTKDVGNMQSVDLNDLVIFAYMDDYTDLVSDTTKTVSIAKYYGKTVVATGHFESYPEFEELYGVENSKALILKLDKPFERGSMKNERGLYCLMIEAATFGDANFGKYIDPRVPKDEKPKPEECRVNSKYEGFTFYIDDTNADKEYPSDEIWRKAYDLLAFEGVGYPTDDCTARKSLESRVDSREGSDAQYITDINNFYNTAVVTMPKALQFYRFKAVSDSTEVYLGYDGKHVTLVDEADATGFVLTKTSDNTYRFQLGDSRYVRQFSASDNVTNEASSVNDFTFAKLAIEGVDAEKTFGKFSLKAENGYALVDVQNRIFMEATAAPAIFTADETCAFVLEEVERKDVKAPSFTPVLTPSEDDQISNLTAVNIIFDCYSEVVLADANKIKLYGKNSKDLADITVSPIENMNNAYVVYINKLPESNRYTLSIGDGAFTFSFAGVDRPIEGYIAIYNIIDTGISGITVDKSDGSVFDLQGRKVAGTLKSGIYIKNGKKVYIK